MEAASLNPALVQGNRPGGVRGESAGLGVQSVRETHRGLLAPEAVTAQLAEGAGRGAGLSLRRSWILAPCP